MAKLSLKIQAPGIFSLLDGKKQIDTISRGQVETKVETLAAVTDPVQRQSYLFWRDVLALFPSRAASLEVILEFADKVGIGLPKRPPDASRAWEMVFNESTGVSEDLIGSDDIQRQVADDDEAVDSVAAAERSVATPAGVDDDGEGKTEVKTGLEGEEGQSAGRGRRGRNS